MTENVDVHLPQVTIWRWYQKLSKFASVVQKWLDLMNLINVRELFGTLWRLTVLTPILWGFLSHSHSRAHSNTTPKPMGIPFPSKPLEHIHIPLVEFWLQLIIVGNVPSVILSLNGCLVFIGLGIQHDHWLCQLWSTGAHAPLTCGSYWQVFSRMKKFRIQLWKLHGIKWWSRLCL